MSNASLKEQLQALTMTITDSTDQKNESKNTTTTKNTAAKKPFPRYSTPHQKNHAKTEQAHTRHTKPKPKWLDYIFYGLELLKMQYPNCFKSGSEIKPLKIGIKQDLVKDLSTIQSIVTEDKACMLKSFVYYVSNHSYYKTMIQGAPRIDLNGHVAGTVTEKEAQYAIEKQQAKRDAKQKSSSVIKPATDPNQNNNNNNKIE